MMRGTIWVLAAVIGMTASSLVDVCLALVLGIASRLQVAGLRRTHARDGPGLPSLCSCGLSLFAAGRERTRQKEMGQKEGLRAHLLQKVKSQRVAWPGLNQVDPIAVTSLSPPGCSRRLIFLLKMLREPWLAVVPALWLDSLAWKLSAIQCHTVPINPCGVTACRALATFDLSPCVEQLPLGSRQVGLMHWCLADRSGIM